MSNSERTYQLKITLGGITPPVWRRVLVSSSTSLRGLERALRIAMGWEFQRPFQFHALDFYGGVLVCNDMSATIGSVLTNIGSMLGYMYDCDSSDWPHTVELENILQARPLIELPECVDGARACPPSVCHGPWDYDNLLTTTSRRHFNPELFLQSQVNQQLQSNGRPSLKRLEMSAVRPSRHLEPLVVDLPVSSRAQLSF